MATTPEERNLVTNTVIKTLRYFDWLQGDDAGKTLLEVAADVELRGGAEDNDCCPVCEEVLCDEDCPFHGFRNPYGP